MSGPGALRRRVLSGSAFSLSVYSTTGGGADSARVAFSIGGKPHFRKVDAMRHKADQDEYLARLVEREIAHARAMSLAEEVRPVDDPMSKYVPWIFVAVILLATVATGASLLAVVFA